MNEWEWQLLEDKPALRSVLVDGVEVKTGDRVRLRPRSGGDVFDLALTEKIATVESIEQDYEGGIHFAVVVEDDPGRDIGVLRQPGHRFFFKGEEIETVDQNIFPAGPQKAKAPKILVAGIGNIFLGDDAFGVEVARRLAAKEIPKGVHVEDFGIRGLDLIYALADGPETTILVDTIACGGAPGDIFVVEPDVDSLAESATLDAHSMDPVNVIRSARAMGARLDRILLLGCEPQTFGPEEGHMGLSEAVARAADRAVALLESLVARIHAGAWPVAGSQAEEMR